MQENFDLLTCFIQDSADKHIPSKTSRSVSSVPWITPEISRKIRRKNKTHAKAKKDRQQQTSPGRIRKRQTRVARFVTGNYNYETGSMTGILGQLKWESLKKRRKGWL